MKRIGTAKKGHSGFSIRCHEKHEWTFWPTQYFSEINKDHEVKVAISLALSLFDKGNKGSISLLNADSHVYQKPFSAPCIFRPRGDNAPYVTSLGVFYCALLVSLNSVHTFAGSTFIKLSSILPVELHLFPVLILSDNVPIFSLLLWLNKENLLLTSQHCILIILSYTCYKF